MQPLPDSSLAAPQRIGDPYIGLISMQQLEDILLICNKKSELLSLLLINWSKCNGKSELPIIFSNTAVLKPGAFSSLVRSPANEIIFKEGWTVIPPVPVAPANNKRKGGKQKHIHYGDTYGLQFSLDGVPNGSKKLSIFSEPGLPHDVVEERNKRRQQRQKKAEQRRKREEKERQERKQAKDEQRELERQAQLADKK